MSMTTQRIGSKKQNLVDIITSDHAEQRDLSLEHVCQELSLEELVTEAGQLDQFRRNCSSLYQRVRALFFLYSVHRFQLLAKLESETAGKIPLAGHTHLLNRRFEEAIDLFLQSFEEHGPNPTICTALSEAYRQLALQTLANQVRRSVRSARGNQWMFRIGHPKDHPLRIKKQLLNRDEQSGAFPVLVEKTAVRMDFSHSGWSDIFFLGMDFPEGARVINASVDLGVRGRDQETRPPIETYFRVIDQPVVRLVSLDLNCSAEISSLDEIFDFAKDYVGLLKAAVIASGLVPPGLEGSQLKLSDLLSKLVGPGMGFELVSNVNDIPKGSRLAVSTNLLGSLIAVCMRATGQAKSLQDSLQENERRIVAARAILGEWIGGSGGGWQDSGGVWPDIKLISGAMATMDDPEHGISRGRLLPDYHLFDEQEISSETLQKLQDSLILVHGGMAQNVGPILEMVTEKYLLRSPAEWQARREAMNVLDRILEALKSGDLKQVGEQTGFNFDEPLQTIIPWVNNLYTQTLINKARRLFGDDFWGFWMLGGMSGGGMGFLFAPARKEEAQVAMQQILVETKQELESALPFAMEPVVYEFSINRSGTSCTFQEGTAALMPARYYSLLVPQWVQIPAQDLSIQTRRELQQFGQLCRTEPRLAGALQTTIDRMLPAGENDRQDGGQLEHLKLTNGFDAQVHEQIRRDLISGQIGLAQNRLSANTHIEDVRSEDVLDSLSLLREEQHRLGAEAISKGEVAVLTLAAGAGSRWTEGAGVVKALHPFCKVAGKHRSFLELHLAKTRKRSRQFSAEIPHLFSTSYMTHDPIHQHLEEQSYFGLKDQIHLSAGKAIGQRMIPMVRDLRFAWETMPQQLLDEQQQKLRDSVRAALIGWAQGEGEAGDYSQNVPSQCLHPVGHWYEVPNLLRNGSLKTILEQQPQLKYLMLHNIDTVGADLAPGLLGLHIESGRSFSFEVTNRHLEDRGGGLARVNGVPRLVESLAIPHEEDEFRLSYYNSMTTWINIDDLLSLFNLSRSDLGNATKVDEAIRELSSELPTYITLKEVKRRWGQGQEDIFPVSQFEKLWGDITTLPQANCGFIVVSHQRGQQLKEQSQLDCWVRDGSADSVFDLCLWE